MKPDFYVVLKIGVFSAFSVCLLLKAWDIKAKKKSVRKLQSQQTKIYNSSQMKKLKEGQQGYFKVKIIKTPFVKKTRDFRYNQYYCCQPSLLPVIMQTKKQFQYEGQDLKYYVSDEKDGSISVNGVGQLIGDVFELKFSYIKNSLGIFRTLQGWLCWFVESFFHFNIIKRRYMYTSSSKRKPAILGPVLGTISYLINLITNSYVIVKCKLVDGELVGQLIAQSKGQLINYYESKIDIQYVKLFLLFAGSIFYGGILIRDLRRWINMNIIKKGFIGRKLYQQQVGQQKQCIICYNQSRNVILYDCRHMILCYQCYQGYKYQHCPVCKSQITEIKVLYEVCE